MPDENDLTTTPALIPEEAKARLVLAAGHAIGRAEKLHGGALRMAPRRTAQIAVEEVFDAFIVPLSKELEEAREALVLATDDNADLREWSGRHKADAETFRARAVELEEAVSELLRHRRVLPTSTYLPDTVESRAALRKLIELDSAEPVKADVEEVPRQPLQPIDDKVEAFRKRFFERTGERLQRTAVVEGLRAVLGGDAAQPVGEEGVYLVRCGACGFLGESGDEASGCVKCGYDGGFLPSEPQNDGAVWTRTALSVNGLEGERRPDVTDLQTRRCTCEGCPHPWRDPNCAIHASQPEDERESTEEGRWKVGQILRHQAGSEWKLLECISGDDEAMESWGDWRAQCVRIGPGAQHLGTVRSFHREYMGRAFTIAATQSEQSHTEEGK